MPLSYSECELSDDKTQLISAPKNAQFVLIPSSVTTIFGSDQEHNAFFHAKDTLISFSFEPDSQLQVIQTCAFYNCKKLEAINLSSCLLLSTISEAVSSD